MTSEGFNIKFRSHIIKYYEYEKCLQDNFYPVGEIYEVFAKQIYQSDMYGFIEVEEYIFNKDKQLVVDPSSEKLKNELEVERSYIPINAILRIDEVKEGGEAKIKRIKTKLAHFH